MQARATAGIKALVDDALDGLPRPLTEDVIDDVFHVIEVTPALRRRYDALCVERGVSTVNTWGGYWVAHAVDRVGQTQVAARKSTLIGTYSKLDRPAPARKSRKLAEAAARRSVFEHYLAHKAELPEGVASFREEIVALVIDGQSVEEAFATALGVAGR